MSTTTTDTTDLADDSAPDEVSPAEAQELEAATEFTGHYVTSTLCGKPLRLIPPGAWRQSWQRMLKRGDSDEFANLVIAPDDLDEYYELDPTNDEVGQFYADAGEVAGESLGKSSGPRPSSRRTRRR